MHMTCYYSDIQFLARWFTTEEEQDCTSNSLRREKSKNTKTKLRMGIFQQEIPMLVKSSNGRYRNDSCTMQHSCAV